jgi:hypothetical protein
MATNPHKIVGRVTVTDADNNLISTFTVHKSQLVFEHDRHAFKLGVDIFDAVGVAYGDGYGDIDTLA